MALKKIMIPVAVVLVLIALLLILKPHRGSGQEAAETPEEAAETPLPQDEPDADVPDIPGPAETPYPELDEEYTCELVPEIMYGSSSSASSGAAAQTPRPSPAPAVTAEDEPAVPGGDPDAPEASPSASGEDDLIGTVVLS